MLATVAGGGTTTGIVVAVGVAVVVGVVVVVPQPWKLHFGGEPRAVTPLVHLREGERGG